MTQNIFAKHIQKTHEWLNQIGELAGWKDHHKSLAALRATLHRLRGNLPVEVVLHLGAQLPLIIRGILFESWHLSECSTKDRKVDSFLEGIEDELYRVDFDAETGAYAVLRVLSYHISPGEVEKIRKVLPHEIGILWDEASAA
jgi:uncharacterized protein (DUF2267 family)